MRLLINYQGLTKIIPDFQSFADVQKFVNENFTELPASWVLEYVDVDGDVITVGTELDVKNMIDTTTSKYLKVTIVAG